MRVSESTFDLYLRNDTNTNGYGNWFYFKVALNPAYQAHVIKYGLGASALTFKFNIVNMYKKY